MVVSKQHIIISHHNQPSYRKWREIKPTERPLKKIQKQHTTSCSLLSTTTMSEEERIAAAEAEVSRLSLNNNNRNKILVSFDRFGVNS